MGDMKSMKKKIILIVIVVLIVPVLYKAYNDYTREVRRCEEVFNVTLPNDAKQIYTAGKSGWMGEGEFIEVYQLSQNSSFNTDDFKSVNINSLEDDIEQLLKKVKVDQKYKPDSSVKYSYKKVVVDDDSLILLYDEFRLQLTAICHIM